MSFLTRTLTYAIVIAGAGALYAGYNPRWWRPIWPAAAPLRPPNPRSSARRHRRSPPPTPNAGAPATPPRPPVSVLVAQVVRKDAPWKIEEIGTAQAISSVALRPHYDATVEKVLVADGAEVKAGDVLITLDSRQVAAQLAQAEAQLAKDEAQLEQAERDVDRYTDLVARSATPILNLDNAKTAVLTSKAAILGDKAAIENLKVQLGWYTVTAPISGRVGVVNIKAGNVAKAGDNGASGVFADDQSDFADLYRVLDHADVAACASGGDGQRRQGRRDAAGLENELGGQACDPRQFRRSRDGNHRRARDLRQCRRKALAGPARQPRADAAHRAEHGPRAARGDPDRPERQFRLHDRRRQGACPPDRGRPHAGRRDRRTEGARTAARASSSTARCCLWRARRSKIRNPPKGAS